MNKYDLLGGISELPEYYLAFEDKEERDAFVNKIKFKTGGRL